MKFGIIGAGMIGHFHAKAITAMSGGSLHSVFDLRAEAAEVKRAEAEARIEANKRAQEQMEIARKLDQERRAQLAGTLSGGEQQMLAFARALVARPKVLLLDEPSMGLAPRLVQDVVDQILRVRDEGVTVLLVEQNAEMALAISDSGYVLETGRVVLSGSGKSLLVNDQVRDVYLGV